MTIVKLPANLTPDLDLAALNHGLRKGEIQLDWSEVQDASQEVLTLLLSGLDLVRDAEALGISTVPDEWSDRIAEAIGDSSSFGDARDDEISSAEEIAAPALWQSDDLQTGDEDIAIQQQDEIETDADEPVSEPKPLLQAPSPNKIREELEQSVLAELLGPAGGPDEEVTEGSVRERYLVGMLAPKRPQEDGEGFDELAAAGDETNEDGSTEPSTPPLQTIAPSSLGMTFTVDGAARAFQVTARWGRYRREDSAHLVNEENGNPLRVWKRYPVAATSPPIPLAEGAIAPWVVTPEQPEVVMRGLMRKLGSDWVVSLFLVNGQSEPQRLRDEAWLFQPELMVDSPNREAIFIKRTSPRTLQQVEAKTAEEESALAMLYRKRLEFAVGHGIAVHAEIDPLHLERAFKITTCVVPVYEVPMQTPPSVHEIPSLAELVLDMKVLAETPQHELSKKLKALSMAYGEWIEEQDLKRNDSAERLADHQDAAKNALDGCRLALQRIQEGIRLLEQNARAAEAFRFANRAMWLQRIHLLLAEANRRGQPLERDAIDIPANRSWYPFQLAFILLNLPGLTDFKHAERSTNSDAIADLLWFPTGGGKTEAYLGLTAYILALRRLQGTIANRDGEHGVAVLMRYTLRLLTLQQFQRAATLICACEAIRREALGKNDKRWGLEPFRLGLWVGQRTTPNWTEQADEVIKRDHGYHQRGSAMMGVGSPAQLTNCPWCGTAIIPGRDIRVDKPRKRTVIYCGDKLGRCLFSERQSPDEGVPALVVDEEVYRRLPALLITTVDKFAQMPWNGATQMLFGQVDGYCPRHGFRSPEIEDADKHSRRGNLPAVKTQPFGPLRPPDLVIQDELHLISGPLGSLVGLYETAVDELCSWEVEGKKVRPKLIASTATIRYAPEQVRRLYLRKVAVFPPHGLNLEDNFFSRQRQPSEEFPGRRYLGMCTPGKRQKSTLIRVYLAYLSAPQKLYEKYGLHADPWMTLVGYFNSIRELGGTRRLIDDDIRARMWKMSERGLADRRIQVFEELTSRKGATDIPNILDRLEIPFDPVAQERRKKRRKQNLPVEVPEPYDILLATNMISVGVDVKRLGLMVVTGQPKSTSEYIQATSRVGRKYPGLICTIYNWARPRDLSHYERFEHYHATFYQYVEALSVTPFASRALDRGLSALLVSLIRLQDKVFNKNEHAGMLDPEHALVEAAQRAILARVASVNESGQTVEEVRTDLQKRLDYWVARVQDSQDGSILGYRDKKDGRTKGLLQPAGQVLWEEFTCLNSLRDVEPTVGLIFDDRGIDEKAPPIIFPAPSPKQDNEEAD